MFDKAPLTVFNGEADPFGREMVLLIFGNRDWRYVYADELA